MFFVYFLGCSSRIKAKLQKKTIEDRLLHFGSSIFHQMNENIANGFPQSEDDLFLEQGVVCSWLGIKRSFKLESVLNVLKWQDEKIGCYKDGNRSKR